MPYFIDQMNRTVELPDRPGRIVSLVPSLTELLFDLGLEKEVSGITKFCVHPPHWRKEKKITGGTKDFHPDRIRALKPDLVIGNKEENSKAGIESLGKEFPVWMSDVNNVNDALGMVRQLGIITGCEEAGKKIASGIEEGFNQLVPLQEHRTCLYLIWRQPYMAAGGLTFINDILNCCGFRNLLSGTPRYPEVSAEELTQLNPGIILLSSEPYSFKERHITEIKNLCPEAEVLLVDGEMFSWYGSRLLKTVPYLQNLLQKLRSGPEL